MIYLQLFYEFFKIGLFSIGGGLATIPFLYELSAKTGWFSPQQITDMIAVSESTPGPIGVNMATYAGYLTCGIPGAVLSVIGLAMPSVIIILLIIQILNKFKNSPLVESVFQGLRPASLGLIAAALISVVQISLISVSDFAVTNNILDLFQWKELILAVLLFFAIRKWKMHPVLYILISAVIGILFQFGS